MAASELVTVEIVSNSQRTVIKIQKEIGDLLKSPNLDANTKQAILNQAIAAQKETIPQQDSQSTTKHTSHTKQQQEDKKDTAEYNKVHIWTEEEEKLLVVLRSEMDDTFKQNVRHEKLWQKIISEMKKSDVVVSVAQARDKWKNLKKSYMEVIDNKKKTGAERKTCRHYEEFNDLYGTRESTNPTCTIDSMNSNGMIEINRNTVTDLTEASPTSTAERREDNIDVTPRKLNKRKKISDRVSPQDKLLDTVSKMEQKNDELFSLMEKQHTEKMARMDRMLDLYERSIQKK